MDRRDRLIQAGLALAAEHDPDALLRSITRLAVELTDARYGALGVLGDGGTHLIEFLSEGLTPEEEAAIGERPKGHGLLGALIADPRPMRVDRIGADPRSVGFPANHPPMTTMLGVPILVRGEVVGDLYLTDKRGGPFTDEDEHTIIVLAAQAAVSIEAARRLADAEQLLVLEDRERIAKDLHDGVIQALFAVGMSLQGAAMSTGDVATGERIEAAVGEIDRVVRDIRNYIFGLRPGTLADRQLAEALADLGRAFEERSGVVTAIEIDTWVASELSSRAADVLQLARESLSNVERHAGATTCRLALWHDGDRACLEVDDDGSGFDPASVARGLGLSNLENRARALGGSMTLETAPGRGTLVRFEVPLS